MSDFAIYLVGGAVRDALLGREVKERDWVVVGATEAQMLQAGYSLVGKDFPVFLHPETKEEYALARTERKTGPGYKGFAIDASQHVSLEDDLKRRDLTINAIAQRENGDIIDPYGGVADLKARKLRHISSAFTEDPVRILRVARFAARYFCYGFRIAAETLTLMRDMVTAGEVNYLVPERVWQETLKALQEPYPRRYFEVLRNCGALAVIFPELDQLYGVPNPVKWHPEIDTGVHTMMVLDAAVALTPDPRIRFAALLHDLGKGVTPPEQWPKHSGHEEAGVALVKIFCERLSVPKDYKELAILVSKFHGKCHCFAELKASTIVKTLQQLDAYRRPQRFFDVLLACTADHLGRTQHQGTVYPQALQWRQAYEITQKVQAKDIMTPDMSGQEIADRLYQQRVSTLKRDSI